MANYQYSRLITKRTSQSGVVPTIPATNDHTDGTWLNTDLYDGEVFMNSADKRIWIRTGSTITELSFDASLLNLDAVATNGSASSVILEYSITPVFTADNNIVNKKYVDDAITSSTQLQNTYIGFGGITNNLTGSADLTYDSGAKHINNNGTLSTTLKNHSEISSDLGDKTGTVALDIDIANYYKLNLTGDITLTFNTNIVTSNSVYFTMEISNGGSFIVTYPANTKWSDGGAPDLTTGTDVIVFYTTDGGNTWIGYLTGEDIQ